MAPPRISVRRSARQLQNSQLLPLTGAELLGQLSQWRLKCWDLEVPTKIIEGSLEVKLPTIWTDEKQSRAEAERRGRLEERRSEEKESGRKKMQMREKVGKSRNTVFFQ